MILTTFNPLADVIMKGLGNVVVCCLGKGGGMFWNRLVKAPDGLVLEVVSSGFRRFLRWMAPLLQLLGVVLLFNAMMRLFPVLPVGLAGVISGMGLLFFAGLLNVFARLSDKLSPTFRFDRKSRTLFMEGGPQDYAFLPREIPFAEIRHLRLSLIRPLGGKTSSCRLELLARDERFYPVTFFKNEEKARRIAREIGQCLGVAVEEQTMAQAPGFREYKTRFLAQFQPETPDSPPSG